VAISGSEPSSRPAGAGESVVLWPNKFLDTCTKFVGATAISRSSFRNSSHTLLKDRRYKILWTGFGVFFSSLSVNVNIVLFSYNI
jgi:hypothetical protein